MKCNKLPFVEIIVHEKTCTCTSPLGGRGKIGHILTHGQKIIWTCGSINVYDIFSFICENNITSLLSYIWDPP